MTVTVIDPKPHHTVVKQAICRECGVTLQYVPNDVKTQRVSDYGGGSDIVHYIECPACNNEVGVR